MFTANVGSLLPPLFVSALVLFLISDTLPPEFFANDDVGDLEIKHNVEFSQDFDTSTPDDATASSVRTKPCSNKSGDSSVSSTAYLPVDSVNDANCSQSGVDDGDASPSPALVTRVGYLSGTTPCVKKPTITCTPAQAIEAAMRSTVKRRDTFVARRIVLVQSTANRLHKSVDKTNDSALEEISKGAGHQASKLSSLPLPNASTSQRMRELTVGNSRAQSSLLASSSSTSFLANLSGGPGDISACGQALITEGLASGDADRSYEHRVHYSPNNSNTSGSVNSSALLHNGHIAVPETGQRGPALHIDDLGLSPKESIDVVKKTLIFSEVDECDTSTLNVSKVVIASPSHWQTIPPAPHSSSSSSSSSSPTSARPLGRPKKVSQNTGATMSTTTTRQSRKSREATLADEPKSVGTLAKSTSRPRQSSRSATTRTSSTSLSAKTSVDPSALLGTSQGRTALSSSVLTDATGQQIGSRRSLSRGPVSTLGQSGCQTRESSVNAIPKSKDGNETGGHALKGETKPTSLTRSSSFSSSSSSSHSSQPSVPPLGRAGPARTRPATASGPSFSSITTAGTSTISTSQSSSLSFLAGSTTALPPRPVSARLQQLSQPKQVSQAKVTTDAPTRYSTRSTSRSRKADQLSSTSTPSIASSTLSAPSSTPVTTDIETVSIMPRSGNPIAKQQLSTSQLAIDVSGIQTAHNVSLTDATLNSLAVALPGGSDSQHVPSLALFGSGENGANRSYMNDLNVSSIDRTDQDDDVDHDAEPDNVGHDEGANVGGDVDEADRSSLMDGDADVDNHNISMAHPTGDLDPSLNQHESTPTQPPTATDVPLADTSSNLSYLQSITRNLAKLSVDFISKVGRSQKSPTNEGPAEEIKESVQSIGDIKSTIPMSDDTTSPMNGSDGYGAGACADVEASVVPEEAVGKGPTGSNEVAASALRTVQADNTALPPQAPVRKGRRGRDALFMSSQQFSSRGRGDRSQSRGDEASSKKERILSTEERELEEIRQKRELLRKQLEENKRMVRTVLSSTASLSASTGALGRPASARVTRVTSGSASLSASTSSIISKPLTRHASSSAVTSTTTTTTVSVSTSLATSLSTKPSQKTTAVKSGPIQKARPATAPTVRPSAPQPFRLATAHRGALHEQMLAAKLRKEEETKKPNEHTFKALPLNVKALQGEDRALIEKKLADLKAKAPPLCPKTPTLVTATRARRDPSPQPSAPAFKAQPIPQSVFVPFRPELPHRKLPIAPPVVLATEKKHQEHLQKKKQTTVSNDETSGQLNHKPTANRRPPSAQSKARTTQAGSSATSEVPRVRTVEVTSRSKASAKGTTRKTSNTISVNITNNGPTRSTPRKPPSFANSSSSSSTEENKVAPTTTLATATTRANSTSTVTTGTSYHDEAILGPTPKKVSITLTEATPSFSAPSSPSSSNKALDMSSVVNTDLDSTSVSLCEQTPRPRRKTRRTVTLAKAATSTTVSDSVVPTSQTAPVAVPASTPGQSQRRGLSVKLASALNTVKNVVNLTGNINEAGKGVTTSKTVDSEWTRDAQHGLSSPLAHSCTAPADENTLHTSLGNISVASISMTPAHKLSYGAQAPDASFVCSPMPTSPNIRFNLHLHLPSPVQDNV